MTMTTPEKTHNSSVSLDVEAGQPEPTPKVTPGYNGASAAPPITGDPACLRVEVPRSLRRGPVAWLCLVPETEVGIYKTRAEKWGITVVVSICGAAGPFGGGIILPVLSPIAEEFHTDAFIANMALALYVLATAIFPLWWSSASELFGRRPVYIVSNSCFAIFSVLSAISPSIPVFLVMRFLTGAACSAGLSVGAGTISDVWEPKERGKAIGYFLLGPLCGPLIAPIIGGGLGQSLGWRSTLWFLSIQALLLTTLVILALPETSPRKLPDQTPGTQAVASDDHPGEQNAHSSSTESRGRIARKAGYFLDQLMLRPLKVLAYLRFPAVALTVYLQSISFGTLYVLQLSLERLFSAPPYDFDSWKIGFVYAPAAVGYILASVIGGPWTDRIMQKRAVKRDAYDENGALIYLPEDRMGENAWLALLLCPAAAIWYGWAAQHQLMWAAVLAPCFVFGFSSFLLVSMSTTMLTEFMPGKSASGVAINNLCRNIIAFAASFTAVPWIDAIGDGWVMTIVGIWIGSLAGVVLLILKYGTKWRAEMNKQLQA